MAKKTLYDIPVNENLIWDYDFKESDYKTERFFKWYLARVLSYGTAYDIRYIKPHIIKKYLPELNLPRRIAKFWFNYLNLKENYMWRVSEARKELMAITDWEKYFTKILYRPFDIREIYYHDSVVWRTRREVMKHMLKENLGLITVRQVKAGSVWNHCFSTNQIIESSVISNKTSEINYLFPLYLYSNSDKKPNFSPEFVKFISGKYDEKVTPEEIFYYIYAVLYSPTYRKKYKEFLQYDFPRIPFVEDYGKFKKLSDLGKELVELHLMKKRLPTKVKFDIPGSNVVEKVKYENGKVWINKKQYFDGVPEDVWNFYIGGYQVLDKWLKSRKNRKLESKDIEQFLQIVEIVRETIGLMEEIDKIKVA